MAKWLEIVGCAAMGLLLVGGIAVMIRVALPLVGRGPFQGAGLNA